MNCPFCSMTTAGQHDPSCPTNKVMFDNMIVSQGTADWMKEISMQMLTGQGTIMGVRVKVSEYVPDNIIVLRDGSEIVQIINTADKAD